MRSTAAKLSRQEGLVIAAIVVLCASTGFVMVNDMQGNSVSMTEILAMLRGLFDR
jgi:hypothetical protein